MAGLEIRLPGLVICGTSPQLYSSQKVAVLSSRSVADRLFREFQWLVLVCRAKIGSGGRGGEGWGTF